MSLELILTLIAVAFVSLFGLAIYYSEKNDKKYQRQEIEEKEKIKEMSCEDLKKYIIDEGDYSEYAQKVLDIKRLDC